MKVFFDSDVILDLLLSRSPFDVPIKDLLELLQLKGGKLFTSVLAGANIFYILSKNTNKVEARRLLEILVDKIKPLSVLDTDFSNAQKSQFTDFEDAIQYYCCEENKMDYIITRNIKDYKLTSIPVLTADQMLIHILSEK